MDLRSRAATAESGVACVPGYGSGEDRHTDAPGQSSVHRPRLQADNAGPLRILVVDDNTDLAVSLKLLLEALGYRVDCAYEGQEALRKAADFAPGVAILDIGLPGIDGYEVARRLRQDFRHRELTLIAATGYSQASDYRRSREVGFDYHLIKPIDFSRLQAILARRQSR